MNEYVTKTEFNTSMGKIDERFTRIDKRFTKIDERFARIDERFTIVDQKFEDLTTIMIRQFERVDNRFDQLNGDISLIKRHLGIKEELFKPA